MTKSTKSQQGGLAPPSLQPPRRARVSRASRAWRVRAIKDKVKVGGFALSAISYYHACEHITRKSRADSCTHYLHARYKCKAGVGLASALTGRRAYFLFLMFAVLGLYLIGVGVTLSRRRRATLRVCINSRRCRWTTPPSPKGGRKL